MNVKKLHDATMKILSETGVNFLHPDARQVLKEHGIRVEGQCAYFTEEQIMKYVKMAPSTINVRAIDPQYNICLGGDVSYNGPAGGSTFIMDAEGHKRDATLDDYKKMIKLYEQNPAYMINGGQVCMPCDVESSTASLALHYISLLLTNKSMWVGSGTYEDMEAVLDLHCAAAGITKDDLQKNCYLINCVNTNTPLQFDKRMTETLFTFAKYNQPVVIAAAAMAGTTSPVTMAGTLAIVNAEVLSVIALAQMYRPGCPVIYGSQTANADMSTCAIAIGSAEAALYYKYCAKLAKFYNLPCRGGGALTDAKSLDVQAGYESMLTYYTCKDNHMNMILQSAGILESYLSASFEKMIVDFEIIDMCNRFFADFEINEETVPLELINELGPGEQYLLEEHTFEYCRFETFNPHVSVRGPRTNPAEVYKENIQKRLNSLLSSYEYPERKPEVLQAMRNVMLKAGITPEFLSVLDAR